MLEFILGFLFGMNSKNHNDNIFEDEMEEHNRKSKYVPKYSGYFKNKGTYYDEDWRWIEPKFRKRYLNIYRGETKTILKGSWYKYEKSNKVCKCIDQRELELMVEYYSQSESYKNIVIYENEKDLVYLNVELKEDIVISIHRYKNNDCYECISCLNYEEAEEILIDMENHYSNYRTVEIIDNINYELDIDG